MNALYTIYDDEYGVKRETTSHTSPRARVSTANG